MMIAANAPHHIHIYETAADSPRSGALRALLIAFVQSEAVAGLLMVGRVVGPTGPHPLPQFEVHLLGGALPQILPLVEASGLRALVHPLTDDDLADHTDLARWIGAPLDLDLTTLDPPGRNRGVARFAKADSGGETAGGRPAGSA